MCTRSIDGPRIDSYVCVCVCLAYCALHELNWLDVSLLNGRSY